MVKKKDNAIGDRLSMADDAGGAVALGDTLTIAQVAAMHAGLGRFIGAKRVTLEAGMLQRVDAAGLQLLAAFVRALDDRGTPFEWQSPTAALRDGARRLGLVDALRLP